MANKGKNTYKRAQTNNNLFTNIVEAYIESNYVLNSDIKALITSSFQWLVSYEVSPLATMNEEKPEGTPLTWTLYAKGRDMDDQGKGRYTESLTAILSIRPSNIANGDFGCFSAKTYLEGDIISVYVGQQIDALPNDASHEDFPYVFNVKKNLSITVGDNGSQLLLGAHKCNDMNFQSSTDSRIRTKGRPLENNAYLEGIYLKARTRIVSGHEIFVDYTSQHSLSKKRRTK